MEAGVGGGVGGAVPARREGAPRVGRGGRAGGGHFWTLEDIGVFLGCGGEGGGGWCWVVNKNVGGGEGWLGEWMMRLMYGMREG